MEWKKEGIRTGLYWFDRLQYIEEEDKLIIFEFFDIKNQDILNITQNKIFNDEDGKRLFDEFTYNKHKIIRNLMKSNDRIIYYLVLYNDDDSKEKVVIEYKSCMDRIINIYINFYELQKWFIKVNDINSTKPSKNLGKITSETKYGQDLIKNIWGERINDDDQGVELVKRLLTVNIDGQICEYETRGFDIDLFLYIDCTHMLNIELALNKKNYLKNTQCNPMRYCWNGKYKDNRRKYISLWKASEILNSKFAILNYNDEDDECGLSFINTLDNEQGIRNETKYTIDKGRFKEAIEETIDCKDIEYSAFEEQAKKVYNYDSKFFDDWEINKKNYR